MSAVSKWYWRTQYVCEERREQAAGRGQLFREAMYALGLAMLRLAGRV